MKKKYKIHVLWISLAIYQDLLKFTGYAILWTKTYSIPLATPLVPGLTQCYMSGLNQSNLLYHVMYQDLLNSTGYNIPCTRTYSIPQATPYTVQCTRTYLIRLDIPCFVPGLTQFHWLHHAICQGLINTVDYIMLCTRTF